VMDFTKVIAEIRKSLDDETVAKVGTLLKDLERGIGELIDDAKADSAESKSRKLKIKELESEKEKLQDEVEKLKSDNSSEALQKQNEELKKENETLKQYQASVLKDRRNSFVTRYDKIKDVVNFDKISKDLKLPEEKDGKLNWESLSDDDISANLEIISKAEEWGLFEKQPGGNPPNRPAAGSDKIKDPFDKFPGVT